MAVLFRAERPRHQDPSWDGPEPHVAAQLRSSKGEPQLQEILLSLSLSLSPSLSCMWSKAITWRLPDFSLGWPTTSASSPAVSSPLQTALPNGTEPTKVEVYPLFIGHTVFYPHTHMWYLYTSREVSLIHCVMYPHRCGTNTDVDSDRVPESGTERICVWFCRDAHEARVPPADWRQVEEEDWADSQVWNSHPMDS